MVALNWNCISGYIFIIIVVAVVAFIDCTEEDCLYEDYANYIKQREEANQTDVIVPA
jgi:hypothetical protein